jgi:DNA-directed RNA polymerase specialized sigma24 family protein
MSTTSEIVERLTRRAAECEDNARVCDLNDYEAEQKLLEAEAIDFRAAAARLEELERENAILREAVLRVHFELGEYIDANGGEVRVNVALAFEIARHAVEAALAGSEK